MHLDKQKLIPQIVEVATQQLHEKYKVLIAELESSKQQLHEEYKVLIAELKSSWENKFNRLEKVASDAKTKFQKTQAAIRAHQQRKNAERSSTERLRKNEAENLEKWSEEDL